MKKVLLVYLFLIISYNAFSQNNGLPAFMIETNAGYAIGVDLDSAMEINVRLIYAMQRFGFIGEVGSFLTPEKNSGHIFIAPMMFIINNEKWKVPLAVGFDLFHTE
jgi:hypothetical protein